MRAYVGVTDDRWTDYLRARPYLDEVNFWQPSARNSFRAIASGEPFVFKSHWPSNRLVGGGFLSGYTRLRTSEAWAFFGEANGVGSLEGLNRSIHRYRSTHGQAPDPDPEIGCILLRDVYFVPDREAVEAPADFAKNIVSGKGYDLETTTGSYMEDAIRYLLRHSSQREMAPDRPMFGDPRLVKPRLGQTAFKTLVLTAYHRRCAITGAKIQPVLEAAHIRPVSSDGEHRVDNGLLLRSDVHTLFDRGYLGVDGKYRLHVSSRLRSEFANGEEFYVRANEQITIPDRPVERPARDAVEWHMDTVFLAS
jgi:putative restriction endonuclease